MRSRTRGTIEGYIMSDSNLTKPRNYAPGSNQSDDPPTRWPRSYQMVGQAGDTANHLTLDTYECARPVFALSVLGLYLH